MTLIRVMQKTLSDGSHVYNVLMSQVYGLEAPQIEFPAVTEADAVALADRLVEAVKAHSVEDIDIRYCY